MPTEISCGWFNSFHSNWCVAEQKSHNAILVFLTEVKWQQTSYAHRNFMWMIQCISFKLTCSWTEIYWYNYIMRGILYIVTDIKKKNSYKCLTYVQLVFLGIVFWVFVLFCFFVFKQMTALINATQTKLYLFKIIKSSWANLIAQAFGLVFPKKKKKKKNN